MTVDNRTVTHSALVFVVIQSDTSHGMNGANLASSRRAGMEINWARHGLA